MATDIQWYQLERGDRLNYPGGGDVIRITDIQCGTRGQIEFVLRTAPNVTWRKSIQIVDTQAQFGQVFTRDNDHGPKSLIVPLNPPEALAGASLLFSKDATLGVDTGMYTVGDLLRYRGKRVEFTWFWDWGASGAPGPLTPVPNPPCPETTDGPATPGGPTRCFIVSATTGSAYSAENMRLNRLRDRVLATTELGKPLLDAIYADYYSFSPPIAADLAENDRLREQVLRTCVRPLLAWYGLLEVLALVDPANQTSIRSAAQAVVDACQADTPPHETLATVKRVFRGDPVPGEVPEPFGYLASRLGNATSLRYASWAIFSPLERAWTCAATGVDVIEQARHWLAEAPLEHLPPPSSGERLDADLGLLARGAFEPADVREQIGARLLAAWPHLAAVLGRHGFIPSHGV